jgi:uncharacterized coiled-coil protein SlyX
MARRRLLRAEVLRLERRVRQLETRLAHAPTLGSVNAAEAELAGLRARMDLTWAQLLDAELKP